MNTAPKYTTQLQAGLGLVRETTKLLEIWQPGMIGQDLLKAALTSGHFPTMSARRLRNIIIEAFCPRYLVEGSEPAGLLKSLAGLLPKGEMRSLFFLYTCRANPILGDFVRQVYWARYAAGGDVVSKEDVLTFILSAVANGKTTSRWSESTIIRMGRYLLGACADFGLLGAMKAEARSISTFRITPIVASILAHDLHFRGLGDNAIVRSEDWALFGLETEDVVGELKRLSLRGELIVQSAGSVTHVAWKYKSMEDLANGLAQG
jgi:hypothetical protein